MIAAPAPPRIDPVGAAASLADLGFLANPDLPDRPGPAYLLVAMRESPTLRHYDPESVEYWGTKAGRGVRKRLTRSTGLPIDTEFSWGLIRIVDRLKVTNEYLTFGGRLFACLVDDAVLAVFTSPAPILRRGGHSQGWDQGADSLGAFFSRFLLAVDYVPGFEALAANADPEARYAAFVSNVADRYRASLVLRWDQPELWRLLEVEERRLRGKVPAAWARGAALRRAAAI